MIFYNVRSKKCVLCENKSDDKTLKFFRFPKVPEANTPRWNLKVCRLVGYHLLQSLKNEISNNLINFKKQAFFFCISILKNKRIPVTFFVKNKKIIIQKLLEITLCIYYWISFAFEQLVTQKLSFFKMVKINKKSWDRITK